MGPLLHIYEGNDLSTVIEDSYIYHKTKMNNVNINDNYQVTNRNYNLIVNIHMWKWLCSRTEKKKFLSFLNFDSTHMHV